MNFANNGYFIQKQVLSKEIVELITQYALFDEMQNPSIGDEQIKNAHSRYADPLMEAVLLKIQKTIESITDLSLHPTYSYYRIYRSGDELVNHTDRPSCEISATVCFDYEYSNKDFQWPIYMNGTALILEPGDIAVYRGCEVPHWRDKFIGEEDDWHIQGFFHYVDVNGPYENYMYDGRSTVGELKTKQEYKNQYPDYIKIL